MRQLRDGALQYRLLQASTFLRCKETFWKGLLRSLSIGKSTEKSIHTLLDNATPKAFSLRHAATNSSHGVTRPGDFPYRLAKEFLKKHNLSEKDVTLATVGGTPTERYAALLQDVFQATLIQPPLDARGKKDGFNVIYNLTTWLAVHLQFLIHESQDPKTKTGVAQKVVAVLAEAVYFVEKNPEQAMASVGKLFGSKTLIRCARPMTPTRKISSPGA